MLLFVLFLVIIIIISNLQKNNQQLALEVLKKFDLNLTA